MRGNSASVAQNLTCPFPLFAHGMSTSRPVVGSGCCAQPQVGLMALGWSEQEGRSMMSCEGGGQGVHLQELLALPLSTQCAGQRGILCAPGSVLCRADHPVAPGARLKRAAVELAAIGQRVGGRDGALSGCHHNALLQVAACARWVGGIVAGARAGVGGAARKGSRGAVSGRAVHEQGRAPGSNRESGGFSHIQGRTASN